MTPQRVYLKLLLAALPGLISAAITFLFMWLGVWVKRFGGKWPRRLV